MHDIVRVLESFECLTNLYIIDYFVDDHWSVLPKAWQEYFESLIVASSKANLLDLIETLLDKTSTKLWPNPGVIVPLSLLSLHTFINTRSIKQHCHVRSPSELAKVFNLPSTEFSNEFTASKLLDTFTRTRIKDKKLHEIERIYELVKIISKDAEKLIIVDIGAGLGHLSRILSTQLNCQVKTIEGNDQLVSRALEIDDRIDAKKQATWKKPIHQASYINEAGQINCSDENTMLIGLHACGDLSSLIIKNFVDNPNVCSLINFGCCYHKLNGGSDKLFEDNECNTKTFPMSQKYKLIKLSYATRELACHANEQFLEQLRSTTTDYYMLKSGYRALLEWLIVTHPSNAEKHQKFSNVKNVEQLDFWLYAKEATSKNQKLHAKVIEMENDESIRKVAEQKLADSVNKLPILYTLRQMIAPLVECLILEDRKCFIEENNHEAFLIPLFDSNISPRNVALISVKK